MKFFVFFIVVSVILASAFAGGSSQATQPRVLPQQFGGWQASAVQLSRDPAVADPANAALLKEYGFSDFEGTTYRRESGEKLVVKAARFNDASGAYGAFTYYRETPWLDEKIGDQGSSLNERVLFYRGNVLIDAVFQKLTAMSAAEMRELAFDIPLPAGSAGNPPSLQAYLPRQSWIKNTEKYVLGPLGLEKIGAPIPSELIGFETEAEVVQGKYNSSGGEATLLVISYPTPQIAADRFRRLTAAEQSLAAKIFTKRSGPMVVVVTGPLSESEAKSLLAAVNYDSNVTWNENTYFSKKDNVGNLVVNVLILCGIIGGFAIVSGVAFGGVRIMVKRIWPGRFFDRPEDVELVTLHLSQGRANASEQPPIGG